MAEVYKVKEDIPVPQKKQKHCNKNRRGAKIARGIPISIQRSDALFLILLLFMPGENGN